ncbi:hypothetical protein FRC0043_01398 [Corynebacterium belfantii]|nr:hypothetical protein FRC0043_01398 [Corynebacterium belfantii]
MTRELVCNNPEVVGSNPAPATKLKPSVRESELAPVSWTGLILGG